MHTWLLLHYKVPAEPSARRVYVWRKLKRLGAIMLHDAVWMLPNTPRTLEQFQWLVTEIEEMGGEARLWEAQPLLAGEENLINQFLAQVDSVYREILDELEKGNVSEESLAALSRRYQQIKRQDFFQSETGQQVRSALLKAQGETELF